VGDGVTDDTDRINAAIDYAYTLGKMDINPPCSGAVIFFPPGIYIVGKGNPGTVRLRLDRNYNVVGHRAALTYVGCGPKVSILRGYWCNGSQMHIPPSQGSNGFLVIANFWSSDVLEIRDLAIENLGIRSTSGALQMQSGTPHVVNCRFKGVLGYYNQEQAFGGSIRDCVAECIRPITAANATVRSPLFDQTNFGAGVTNGSVGFFLGQGFAHNCQAFGFDIGFVEGLYAQQLVGCKASRCGVGILSGYISAATPQGQ